MRILIITLLLISTLLIPVSVFADDEQQVRWNTKISGVNGGITKMSYPPCLTEQQGQRWIMASATSKVHLAFQYMLSKDTAELYGAKFMKYPYGGRWSTVYKDNSSEMNCTCNCK